MTEPVRRIHHLNFLVRDLDEAEARYRDLLGAGPAQREELPDRGVRTARFRIGETWLVLVQPTGEEGEPARHLREHGEGFFLASFEVENLERAMVERRQLGLEFTADSPRRGLDGWRVIDVDPAQTLGATLQLVQEY